MANISQTNRTELQQIVNESNLLRYRYLQWANLTGFQKLIFWHIYKIAIVGFSQCTCSLLIFWVSGKRCQTNIIEVDSNSYDMVAMKN
jgi:hypothetical protein